MGNIHTFTPPELKARLARDPKPLLIDVLPSDYFNSRHIPGARNACVYETGFIGKIAEMTSDKSFRVIVYGSSDRSLDSTDAVQKLVLAGYTNVAEFPGGLESWQEYDYPVEGTNQPVLHPEFPSLARYKVDVERSVIFWVGRNIVNSHDGTLGLKGGHATFANGKFESADITIDMDAMTCSDIADESLNGFLIAHLKSDDFFETDRYPVAQFHLVTCTEIQGVSPGLPNYSLSGTLTIKGETNPVTFDAVVAPLEENEIVLQAHFDIDRTKWNVRYGSGKLYDKLGKHLVNDDISLQLRVFLKQD